jgi:hypothetical protein
VAAFQRAEPHWHRAQQQTRTHFGEERWRVLINLINEVTSAVTE